MNFTISFRKLPDGKWGAHGPAAKLQVGAIVEIVRKDGSKAKATVLEVVSTDPNDGTALARVKTERDRTMARRAMAAMTPPRTNQPFVPESWDDPPSWTASLSSDGCLRQALAHIRAAASLSPGAGDQELFKAITEALKDFKKTRATKQAVAS